MEIASDFQYYLMMVIFFVLIPVGFFYAPWVIRSTIQYLNTNYPREQYPGVISISPKILIGFTWLDTAAGIIAILALSMTLTFWQEEMKDPFTVVIFISSYLFFRLVLWIVFGVKGVKYLKELQPKAPAKRSVNLQAVKITDYISPVLIVLSMILTTVALVITVWWYVTDAGANPATPVVSVMAAFSLIMKLRQLIWGPTFKRIDPFISHEDLFKQRRAMLRMQFCGPLIWVPVILFLIAPGWIRFTPSFNFSFLIIIFTAQFMHMAWLLKRWQKYTDISVYRVSDTPKDSGASIISEG